MRNQLRHIRAAKDSSRQRRLLKQPDMFKQNHTLTSNDKVQSTIAIADSLKSKSEVLLNA